jgi:3-hydroxyacyl-[acyl-carrier-protein] dehydratase
MRFSQVDRITELVPGESITAVRSLTLTEEYLKDHFPRFPVMPGVLVVEALFQAGMWLVRVTNRFQHSIVALRKTQNMKFSGFVQPGDQLVLSAAIKSQTGSQTKLKVSGRVRESVTASGMITIDSYNLADRNLGQTATDDYMKQKFRLTYKLLCNQLDDAGLARLADF